MTTVQEFFDDKVRLPSPPAIALKILEAVRQEENSFDDLARIIRADPSLSVRILKVANSSLYGLTQPVDSLAQATGLIGTDALKILHSPLLLCRSFRILHRGVLILIIFGVGRLLPQWQQTFSGRQLGTKTMIYSFPGCCMISVS